MPQSSRFRRRTPTDMDYATHLPKLVRIVPAGTTFDDDTEAYDPKKKKQVGVPCPCCNYTWTVTSYMSKLKEKDSSTEYLQKIMTCLTAEN
jgi:hypothetical protein